MQQPIHTGTSDPVGDLADRTRQTASQAQQIAGDLAGQVRQEASARLSGQIEQVVHSLGGASDAFRGVGVQLRQQEQGMLAGYAERAAETVQNAASYLEGKELDEIVHDVEDFARRQPAVFLGGAFALGLLASRFLKSSNPSTGYGKTAPRGRSLSLVPPSPPAASGPSTVTPPAMMEATAAHTWPPSMPSTPAPAGSGSSSSTPSSGTTPTPNPITSTSGTSSGPSEPARVPPNTPPSHSATGGSADPQSTPPSYH
jgi:hypothetical protein